MCFWRTKSFKIIDTNKNVYSSCICQSDQAYRVQTLPIRIIEKIIKQNLDNCQLCKSTELPIYQTGFQPNMSTMINLIRVKSVINKNRKRSKNKKFIFFLDLTKAFDTIERSYIISAIHNIIKTKTNCWEKCWTLWAFTIQLIKIRSA